MKRPNLKDVKEYLKIIMMLSLCLGILNCEGDTSTLVDSVKVNKSDSSTDVSQIDPVSDPQAQDAGSGDEISQPEMISGSHLVKIVCESVVDEEQGKKAILCRYSDEDNQIKIDPAGIDQVRIEIRDRDGNLIDGSAYSMTIQPADSNWSVRIDILDNHLSDWRLSFYQTGHADESSPAVNSYSQQEIFGTALTQTVESEEPVTLDTTPPESVQASILEATVDAEGGSLKATWDSVQDSGLGLSHYLISVGSAPEGFDLVPWTNTSLSTSWSGVLAGITYNQTYYFNIKAVDFAGNESGIYTGTVTFNYNLSGIFGNSLMLWLDAMDASGSQGVSQPTDLELMTTWVDKSSNGFNFSPSPGADAPQFLESGISAGKPGLHFRQVGGEGPAKMMKNDTIDLRQGTNDVISSISVYVKRSNYSPEIWVGTQNDFSKRRHSMGEAPRNVPVMDIHEFRYSSLQNNTQLLVTHNKNTEIYYNALTFEDEPASAGMAMGCLLYSWADYTGAYFGDFVLGELILINRVLTPDETEKMWYYLSKKWNIPFSAP